jgi:hypothetical protein
LRIVATTVLFEPQAVPAITAFTGELSPTKNVSSGSHTVSPHTVTPMGCVNAVVCGPGAVGPDLDGARRGAARHPDLDLVGTDRDDGI